MTEEKKATSAGKEKENPAEAATKANAQSLHVQVLAHYLRDVSFENPNAPHSLQTGQDNPQTELSFNLESREIDKEKTDDLYEVIIKVTAKASRGKDVVFLAEVDYGTLVALKDVPADARPALLMVEVPRLTFPFVRKILADLTQEGGFPPLLLNPVDFAALYTSHRKAA